MSYLEKLQKKKAVLVESRSSLRNQVAAHDGAIQVVDELIAELEEPAPIIKTPAPIAKNDANDHKKQKVRDTTADV
jgi:hypothetical protein